MIELRNKHFVLKLNDECKAVSLVHSATGIECLDDSERISLFSLTEPRPYNNEIKLAHPNKRTTFQANRVRRDGNRLIVGFELITFEAVVEISETDDYIAFSLSDFIVKPEDFGGLAMSPPPISEFRLLQLPIKKRERFGEWLNVMWDDDVAINVLATSPFTRIDAEKRKDFSIMSADSVQEIKLKNSGAALIVSSPKKLLDCIDRIEHDFDLPLGVESRRSDKLNSSIYWVPFISPQNVDEHISYAKKCGMRMMLIYYTSFIKGSSFDGYHTIGDFELDENFPGGLEDVKKMLQKIKDAGITPGFHLLHSHIGIGSCYVTPVADHRLNLTRYFTLARPLERDDDIVYVEQNPEGAVMHPDCRVLKFGGELIGYESYTTEWPYAFKGCKRGHFDTNVLSHSIGTIGGILDISEFSATSVYVDQRTTLQDELAEKYAPIYDAGFEFLYFDGSEGVNPPFEINVPYAQYRIYRKLKKAPLFCEAAAKAHFSWHMLSGGNAFDAFPAEIFKEKIAEHPLEEAPRMANDFTRLNFGWWRFSDDIQPDMYEYGTSKAASWDCPVTMQVITEAHKTNPRAEDIFEVLYRWEDVRAKKLLTEEEKEMLKDASTEYILLVNEEKEYELCPYYRIETSEKDITAYHFERKGKTHVVCWHTKGDGVLSLPLSARSVTYEKDLGGVTSECEISTTSVSITVSGRRYFSADVSKDELIRAFENAVLQCNNV